MIDPSARITGPRTSRLTTASDMEPVREIGPRSELGQNINEGAMMGDRVKAQDGALIYRDVTVADGGFFDSTDHPELSL